MNSRENNFSQKSEKGTARFAPATGQALSDADKMTQQPTNKENTMKKKLTSKQVEEELNEIGCPDHDHPENGGRCTWAGVKQYGTWLRRHDPIAFQMAKQDLEQN